VLIENRTGRKKIIVNGMNLFFWGMKFLFKADDTKHFILQAL
jgi:hypothetical protein